MCPEAVFTKRLGIEVSNFKFECSALCPVQYLCSTSAVPCAEPCVGSGGCLPVVASAMERTFLKHFSWRERTHVRSRLPSFASARPAPLHAALDQDFNPLHMGSSIYVYRVVSSISSHVVLQSMKVLPQAKGAWKHYASTEPWYNVKRIMMMEPTCV